METIWQSNIATTVNRVNEHEIQARCVFVSTGYEAVAQITAAVDTFAVQVADWEIYRSPGARLNSRGEAAALLGTEAYLQAASALKTVAGTAGELPKQLLADCVKGIIQAETYLYRERGFPTAETYEAYWKTQYLNSCRAYSNLDRVTHSWSTHIATRAWGDCLFNRFKPAVVTSCADGSLQISGSFTDSFHELYAALDVVAGVITASSGGFLRAPDPVCRENTAHFAGFTGRAIADLSPRETGRQAGGPQGCNHLVDLVNHLTDTYRHAAAGC